MICLDTDAVIALINGSSTPVRARLAVALQMREVVAISIVVLFEIRYGAAKSANPRRASHRMDDFLSGPIQVLDFEQDDAEEAGDLIVLLHEDLASDDTVYRALKQLGFGHFSARPGAYRQDAEAMEVLRKLPGHVAEIRRTLAPGTPVGIWFQSLPSGST